ncbi:AAA family ATPase [Phenylobacterium terrae]|uniref:AAA family ATPase n=1 Tax=Phenylobacterium terrae TaxID=2665495 RepID=A0ABW4N2V5_9CAUL
MSEEAEVAGFLGGRSESVIETSCARVFLNGPQALKVKRRLDLGFLDFTTLEKRRWAVERELAFNQATAPDIYRAVRRITREADGRLAVDGAGEVVDYALEMRRFDETAVLSERPEAVDGDLAEALGRLIARAHAAAPVRPDAGGLKALKYTIDSNAEVLGALTGELGEGEVADLVARTYAALRAATPLLEARKAAGFGRRCHADLHLGNILLENGRPVLFDCIEFNDQLSDIDVQYDVAFLLMDLAFRGRGEAGARVLATWLDQSARTFGPAVYDGLAALPLMLSVRAAVRAHVAVHSGDVERGRDYLAAARRHLSPPPPRLAAVGGLSGAGKSTFARAAAPALGAPPGAVVLRTDEVRKRLAGVDPLERLPASAYEPAFYAAVYDAVFDAAARMLRAGWSVVLDASFVDDVARRRAEALAGELAVPFDGVWLEAPTAVLEQRVRGRTADASDATVETIAMQQARNLGRIEWLVMDVTDGAAPAAQSWASRRGLGEAK